MSYLCISVRWLDDRYHGKNADGGPEWPPSPLRLFQALLASAYRMSPEADSFLKSFHWLQNHSMHEPAIIAPRVQSARRFIRFVPNNDSDKVFDRQNRLAAKKVCPTLLLDTLPIHYVWELPEPITDEIRYFAGELCEIARSVVTFGWGVDMAAGTGSIASIEYVNSLPGERWLPNRNMAGMGLRVPCSATLTALLNRNKLFVNRLQNHCFSDLPPLDESAFRVVGYGRATDPIQRPFAAFKLFKPDGSGSFRAFDTVQRGLTVAGMLRHATELAARHSWPEPEGEDFIKTFILGHGETKGAAHVTVGAQRFAYLPLPSIGFRGQGKARVVGSIRRALLTTLTDGYENEIAWAQRALSGQVLIDEDIRNKPAAELVTIPAYDDIVKIYVQPSSAWATVTPVVLPGYDDPKHYRRRMKHEIDAENQSNLLIRLYDRIDGLLRKSIVQAGFPRVMADCAEIEWRKVGFWPGTDMADRYGIPDHLKRFPRFHVRIRWRDTQYMPVEVPGPICLGGGRFYGLGLFAAE